VLDVPQSSLDGVVDDLLEIARIPGPTFAEEARLAWIGDRIADLPGARRRDETGNLIWEWGRGRPRLLLAAHVDTVFDEETPLEIHRADSTLTGPGVGDNAAAVAVVLNVAESLLSKRELAPGAVVFTVGEEGLGNLRGANAACKALSPDTFVAVEGHGLEEVVVDAIGSIRARLSVAGPGGHPWVDKGDPSAIHALLQLATAILADAPEGAQVNIGSIAGGRSVNVIADTAELLLEARADEDVTLQQMLTQLRSLACDPPLALAVDIVGTRPAGRLERGSRLLSLVREVRAELGLPDALGSGSTDANAALARGIPALTLGVATGSGMHSTSERIDLDSLGVGLRQIELVVERLLAPTE
jgi:acetylornithine deacetylase/succinyl-diaminopimelate desuccinylase-like protein